MAEWGATRGHRASHPHPDDLDSSVPATAIADSLEVAALAAASLKASLVDQAAPDVRAAVGGEAHSQAVLAGKEDLAVAAERLAYAEEVEEEEEVAAVSELVPSRSAPAAAVVVLALTFAYAAVVVPYASAVPGAALEARGNW